MTILRSNMTLQRLLDANRRFDLNGRGTSNHCPMALTALADMGADPLRLEQFFQFWEKRHALPAPDQPALERATWPMAIGQRDLFCATRDCFAAWVVHEGDDTVLRKVIGAMSLAPASGAFHALIRLAYGLEAGNANEIGAGLAAMVCGKLAIDPGEGRPAASVQKGLDQLSQVFAGAKVEGTWIAPRLRTVARMPAFQANLPAMPPEEDMLSILRRAALALY